MFFSIHCYELLYCLSLFFNFDGADGNLRKVTVELEVIFFVKKKKKEKPNIPFVPRKSLTCPFSNPKVMKYVLIILGENSIGTTN